VRKAAPEAGRCLLLDKPVGPSSSAVLQAVKRLLNAEKAGHAGTLDPLASGCCRCCSGGHQIRAVRSGRGKEYVADVSLGSATDTGDAEGTVVDRRRCSSTSRPAAALARFRGTIEQVPPMYSALKHEGQPLYVLARAGETVSAKPEGHRVRAGTGFAPCRPASPSHPLQ
jgi:tRNA pseudouridine55 synthase